MNSLWVFGCSISDYKQPKELKKYVDFKGYEIETWSEILSKKLNYKLENYAISGGSNNSTLEEFSKRISSIKKNDLVIINWTECSRFRLVINNEWWKILPFHLNHPELTEELKKITEYIQYTTLQDILLNRTHNLYLEEIDNWYNLIKTSCDLLSARLFFWGLHVNREYTINRNKENLFDSLLKEFGSIQTETNNLITDGHFSERSHIECADFFYKKYFNDK